MNGGLKLIRYEQPWFYRWPRNAVGSTDVVDYGIKEGRGFESLRSQHLLKGSTTVGPFVCLLPSPARHGFAS